ncbi:MAG: hypothetical protein GWN04_00435 [Gammaproteobacteria bacterium]|nr:hypothetical protein [Gammaproteobacteria bacterium]NIX16798.1 hypothetical protein [Gammaproteobacteria bacterium]
MKKMLIVLLVTFVLTLSIVSLVAADGEPVGGCPDDFHSHMVMNHDQDHMGQHQHVGNDTDLNGDGWICGKHVGTDGSIHVHIDNNVPLP